MRERPDHDWGEEALLKEVLDSSALDEPSGEDLARLCNRLAGTGIGIAATSVAANAAASGSAVGAAAVTAAAGKGALGFGIVVKVTSAVVIATTVSVGAIQLTKDSSVREGGDAPKTVRTRPDTEPYEVRPLLSDDDLAAFDAPPLAERLPPRHSPAATPISPSPAQKTASRERPAATSVAKQTRVEAELLQRARSALGLSPREALDLARSHERRYPAGLLAEEREVIVINALKRLGREQEACARAARFVSAHPRSTVRPELEKLCEPHGSSRR